MNSINHHQRGFIFTWASFLTLPMLSVGFVFLFYGLSNIAKIRAQLDAMNVVIFGGFSAEFDSGESLNAMAMYAEGLGFNSVAPVETGQTFDSGALIFEHDSSTIGAPRILAYIKRNQGAVSRLVSHLGSVETAGFSLTVPDKFFTQLSIDYSSSLAEDATTQDLLKAFGVIDPDDATKAGPNGVISATGEVVPSPAIQNAIPAAIHPELRYPQTWTSVNTAFPVLVYYFNNCTPGSEIACGSSRPSQQGSLYASSSDQFMSYKRAATILVGVVAQTTPYLDVYTLAGPLHATVAAQINFATQGSPEIPNNPIDAVDNSGHFPLWKYDEADLGNIAINMNANPIVSATVAHQYSVAEPKNPFRDSIQIGPSRPATIMGLVLAYYRKALKYFTFTDVDGNVVSSPGQYSAYFEPPLPVRNDYVPPTDSFVTHPGPLVGADSRVENALFFWYGWPSDVSPFMATSGLTHPPQSEMPPEMLEMVEYNCETGPPTSTNVPFSQVPGTAGWAACKIYDWCLNQRLDNDAKCDAINPDGSAAGPIDSKDENAYYSAAKPKSPGCTGPGEPRCPVIAGGSPSSTDFPACVNGMVRCAPSLATQPLCWVSGSNSFTAERPSCTPGVDEGVLPGRISGSKNVRGYVEVPANPAQSETNSLFFALMDLGVQAGGTYTHAAVQTANARCAEFRANNGGVGDCILGLVTDGVPKGLDYSGNHVYSDAEMMTLLTTQIDIFTDTYDGKVFTWFLGNKNRVDRLIAQFAEQEAAGTLSPAQQDIYNSYLLTHQAIPDESCADFEAVGVCSCGYYNDILLPEYISDAAMLTEFKALMNDPPNRVLIETSISNSAAGGEMSESFVSGLKEFLAVNKREIKLGM